MMVMLKITDPNLILLNLLIKGNIVLHLSLTQLTRMLLLEISKIPLELSYRSLE